jgi:cytochrome P450
MISWLKLKRLPDDFEDADLRDLPLLNSIIEETLRLYASIPSALPRVVPAGGVTMSGYYLRSGTIISSQAYSLHRDPEVYPRPEEFNPSRWENPTKAMRDNFFAFGGGSRSKSHTV